MIILSIDTTLSIARITGGKILDCTKIFWPGNEILQSTVKLEEYVRNIITELPAILNRPVYISIGSGCGIEYRTFSVSLDTFAVNGSRTTKAERDEAIKETCQSRIAASDYIPCVINAYQTDTDYIMSVAYIPETYLKNLKHVFYKLEVSVFNIHPLAYLTYRALDKDKFSQLLIDFENELLLVNPLGIIGWRKPEEFDMSIAENFLLNESQALYGLDSKPEICNYTNLGHYLPEIYKIQSELTPAIISAIGILNNQSSKGGIENAANKFRQLFNKGRNKREQI